MISLELTIAACVSTQYFQKYDDKYKLPLFSLDKQIKKAEKDDIVEENESLKKAFENRIKKVSMQKRYQVSINLIMYLKLHLNLTRK